LAGSNHFAFTEPENLDMITVTVRLLGKYAIIRLESDDIAAVT
jgi:hypothetical protein